MLVIWSTASALWVAFALYNIIAVAGDLIALLGDDPTPDELTVAWQRLRDTMFRLFLSCLFTATGILSPDNNEREQSRSFTSAALLYCFLITPIIGCIFEGWRIRDRWHMGAAYAKLYRREKERG